MIVKPQELVYPWQSKNIKLPKNFIISDSSYHLPTSSVIRGEIFPNFWRWLITLKLTRWHTKWDCDNFADAFKVFSAGYFRNTIESEADSLAIGTIYYIANSRAESGMKGAHAINIVYYSDDDKTLRYMFIEPQMGNTLDLSEEEFNSIYVVYL